MYKTRSRKYYAEVEVAHMEMRETRSRKYYAKVEVARIASLRNAFCYVWSGPVSACCPYRGNNAGRKGSR